MDPQMCAEICTLSKAERLRPIGVDLEYPGLSACHTELAAKLRLSHCPSAVLLTTAEKPREKVQKLNVRTALTYRHLAGLSFRLFPALCCCRFSHVHIV